jgi:hypothetical protein
MALFVDGPVATIDDLTDQDSGLLEVAQTCGINVTSKLRLAHDQIGTDLHLWLNRPLPTPDLIWGAVVRIEQVVMTTPLKGWETMTALELFYRDAYFSQFADRYQAKYEQYSKLGRTAYEQFLASGLGLVNTPVYQALPPTLGSISAPQRGGTFYASVAWVNVHGQEGAVSAASSITLADGNLMTVSASGTVVNATGFNVYAGNTLDSLYAQNDLAIAPGASYTFVPGLITGGRLPGSGQKPDFTRPLARTWMRG